MGRLLALARWSALIATIAAVLLWIASGWLLIGLRYGGNVYQAGIQIRCGLAGFYVWTSTLPGPVTGHPTSIYVQSVKMTGDTPGTWTWTPVRYRRRLDSVSQRGVTVAFWLICAAGAGATWRLWRYRPRPRPGRCACGYDLSGTTSDRCPECGTTTRITA